MQTVIKNFSTYRRVGKIEKISLIMNSDLKLMVIVSSPPGQISLSHVYTTRPSVLGLWRTLWKNPSELGATHFLWQEIIPREERQTNQGSPSREKSQSRKQWNPHCSFSFSADVSCQLLIFSVYGSDFLFLLFRLSISFLKMRWTLWNREYWT